MSMFSEEVQMNLTAAEVAKVLRKAPTGSRFRLSVRVELPIEGTPDRIFPGMASIAVSRKEMIRAAVDMVRGFEARGARVPLRMNVMTVGTSSTNCYFI